LREIESIRPGQTRVATEVRLLTELDAQRRNLLDAFYRLRDQRGDGLRGTVKKLNRKLDGKFRLNLKIGAQRQTLMAFLLKMSGLGEKKLAWIEMAGGELNSACTGSSHLQWRRHQELGWELRNTEFGHRSARAT